MTSMPASRSARATTLAPRSCPSSPGLATTTRMRPCATVPAALSVSPAGPRSAAGPHLGRYYPAADHAPEALRGRPPVPAPDHDPPRPGPDPGQVPLRPGRDPGGSGRLSRRPGRPGPRKLILRSQLGRGWIVASALFGLVILVAGVLFLTRTATPARPGCGSLPCRRCPRARSPRSPGRPARSWSSTAEAGAARLLCPARPLPGAGAGSGFCPPLRRPALGPDRRPGQQPPRRPGGPSPLRPVTPLFAGGDLYVNPAP